MYSISNTGDEGPVKNQVAKAIVERIIRAGAEGKKFRIVVVIPEVPGFAGQSKSFDMSAEFDSHYAHSQGRDVCPDDHGGPVPYHEPWWPQYLRRGPQGRL